MSEHSINKLDELFIDYLVSVYAKTLPEMSVDQVFCMRNTFYAGAKVAQDGFLKDVYGGGNSATNTEELLIAVDAFGKSVKNETLHFATAIAILARALHENDRRKRNKSQIENWYEPHRTQSQAVSW